MKLARSLLFFVCITPVIWEVGWAGTPFCPRCEWVEIYNPSSKTITLENWILQINQKNIKLRGKIYPDSFFLIARKKHETLENIDLVSSFSLPDKGASIKLLNPEGVAVDKAEFTEQWPAGSQKERKSMERRFCEQKGSAKLNWHTSSLSPGTPKKPNTQEATLYLQPSQRSSRVKRFIPLILISLLLAWTNTISRRWEKIVTEEINTRIRNIRKRDLPLEKKGLG